MRDQNVRIIDTKVKYICSPKNIPANRNISFVTALR